jgi:hypothetical protein
MLRDRVASAASAAVRGVVELHVADDRVVAEVLDIEEARVEDDADATVRARDEGGVS